MKKVLSLALSLMLIFSMAISGFAVSTEVPERSPFDGIWEGSLPVFTDKGTYYNDIVTIDIDTLSDKPVLLKITSMSPDGLYVPPRAYQMYDSTFNFELYDDSWYSVAELKLTDALTLEGMYTQKEHKMPVEFKKVSNEPLERENMKTENLFDGENEAYWLGELKKYPSYGSKGNDIPFTYEMMRWDKNLPLINIYGLDKVMDGRSDIDIMKSLLQLVSDNFKHDGSVAITDKMDPLSIVALHGEKGGIECRGLAIILSEMLRTCGIEAKPIMCISSKEPAECHVVVHAYSPSLNQWVMLDPTYNLMLKDKDGNYVDLPHLRNILINEEPLYAEKGANHNDTPFYMPKYREYMTKNTFRFASARDFYFGADIFPHTDEKGSSSSDTAGMFGESAKENLNSIPKEKNPIYMLVPEGYEVPYAGSREEIITRDAESFWALPERSKGLASSN